MNRVQPVTKEKASAAIKPMYDQLEKKMGRIPNIFLNMGNSPQALNAFMVLSDIVDKTSLSQDLKSRLALIVAETNHCNYCLSAHSAIAKSIGLPEQDILNARKAQASDKKTEAVLQFAKSVVQKRGEVSDQEVQLLKMQGITDQEICEIILVITLNNFTNYFNKVVNTEIDFPVAPKLN